MSNKGCKHNIPTDKKLLSKIKVNNKTQCWEWQAAKYSNGYGAISVKRKNRLAHRVSYELYIGELIPKMYVCHKCDNPCCVNPFHLFLGSPTDNILDCIKKERKYKTPHPSITSYMNGCRCIECVQINRVKNRARYKPDTDAKRARRRELRAKKVADGWRQVKLPNGKRIFMKPQYR